MRITSLLGGLLLLSVLCTSCTKQDLSEDDNLIINKTFLDTGDDQKPPPSEDD